MPVTLPEESSRFDRNGYVNDGWVLSCSHVTYEGGLNVPDGLLVARVVAGTAAGNAGLRGLTEKLLLALSRFPGGDILTN